MEDAVNVTVLGPPRGRKRASVRDVVRTREEERRSRHDSGGRATFPAPLRRDRPPSAIRDPPRPFLHPPAIPAASLSSTAWARSLASRAIASRPAATKLSGTTLRSRISG